MTRLEMLQERQGYQNKVDFNRAEIRALKGKIALLDSAIDCHDIIENVRIANQQKKGDRDYTTRAMFGVTL